MQLASILLIRNKLFSMNKLILVCLIAFFVYIFATSLYREQFATPPYNVAPNYIKYTIYYDSGSGSGDLTPLNGTNKFILNPDPLASYSGVVTGSIVPQQ